jgi:hypothetical protein
MVASALILAAGMMLAAPDTCADECEPEMHRSKLPPVKSITIREIGVRSSAALDSPEQCGKFVLSRREVTEFVSQAGEVAEPDYHHLLDWSPCFVTGDVTFKNGLTGRWGIHQLKAGTLTLSNGRKLYMYCPKCRAKAFLPEE